MVWDVLWGGSFFSANGAASAAVREYAMTQQHLTPQSMPEMLGSISSGSSSESESNVSSGKDVAASQNQAPVFRRHQILHELRFDRTSRKTSWATKLDTALCSMIGECVALAALVAVGIVLALLGLYGSAVLIISNGITQMVCSCNKITRPSSYLQSNEESQEYCMLVATHQNVNTWYMFTGDRGVVDSLLNKTMVDLPAGRFSTSTAHLLTAAHAIQLLGMTFVAAQKGWDGVCLVILLFASRCFRLRYGNAHLTKMWLEREGISVEARLYRFTGRTMMLGAVQRLSGSKTTGWTDTIITAHPRREAWLAYLMEGKMPDPNQWGQHDLQSIVLSAQLAGAAAEVIRTGRATRAQV